MKHAALLDNVRANFFRSKTRVRARFTRKGKRSLALLGQRHKCKSGEVVGIGNKAVTVDVGGYKSGAKKISVHVGSYFADNRRALAKTLKRH